MGYQTATDNTHDYVLVHKNVAAKYRELADENAILRAELAIAKTDLADLQYRATAAAALWQGARLPLPPATDN
jgi:hypothetical protein